MKKHGKLLGILLAAAFLLPCLAACGGNETATATPAAPASQAPQESCTYEGLALTCEAVYQTVHLGIGDYLWVNQGERRIFVSIGEEYSISAAGISDLREQEVESVDIPAGISLQMGMTPEGYMTLTGLEGSVRLGSGESLPIAAPESPENPSLGFSYVLAQFGTIAETITVTRAGDSSFSRTIAAGDEIVITGDKTDGYSVIF